MSFRRVFLRNLILPASIGIHAHEQHTRQRVRLNIDLDVADTPGGQYSLSTVVDYEVLAGNIRELVGREHIRLVETLAERIAAVCLSDPRVAAARIRVEKLDVFADAESAGVEIDRRR